MNSSGVDEQDPAIQAELQQFVQQENNRSMVQAVVSKISNVCWDKCVGDPDRDLTHNERICLQNCTERFLDTSLFIASRMQQKKGKKLE